MLMGRLGVFAVCAIVFGQAFGQDSTSASNAYQPTPEELQKSYERADKLPDLLKGKAYKLKITPHWFAKDRYFWYRNDLRDGVKEFILMDASTGHRTLAFDHNRLADELSKVKGTHYLRTKLPFSEIKLSDDLRELQVQIGKESWACDLRTYKLSGAEPTTPEPPAPDPKAKTPPPLPEIDPLVPDESFLDPEAKLDNKEAEPKPVECPDERTVAQHISSSDGVTRCWRIRG